MNPFNELLIFKFELSFLRLIEFNFHMNIINYKLTNPTARRGPRTLPC